MSQVSERSETLVARYVGRPGQTKMGALVNVYYFFILDGELKASIDNRVCAGSIYNILHIYL